MSALCFRPVVSSTSSQSACLLFFFSCSGWSSRLNRVGFLACGLLKHAGVSHCVARIEPALHFSSIHGEWALCSGTGCRSRAPATLYRERKRYLSCWKRLFNHFSWEKTAFLFKLNHFFCENFGAIKEKPLQWCYKVPFKLSWTLVSFQRQCRLEDFKRQNPELKLVVVENCPFFLLDYKSHPSMKSHRSVTLLNGI